MFKPCRQHIIVNNTQWLHLMSHMAFHTECSGNPVRSTKIVQLWLQISHLVQIWVMKPLHSPQSNRRGPYEGDKEKKSGK